MAKKKRASKKPAKKLASVSASANAQETIVSEGPAGIHRFTLASVAAQLNRAAVSHDGALPRRELDVSRSATKRNKPCTLEEAVDDTRSHLDDAFLHEDWQPFTVNYDGYNATVSMSVPLSLVVIELDRQLQRHAETSMEAEPGTLPDGIDERSPLAVIMHALPKSLQARMQVHAGVHLGVPWPLAESTEHVPHRDFEHHLQTALAHNPQSRDPIGNTSALLAPVKSDLHAVKDGLRNMFELPSEIRNPGRHFDRWCKPQPYSVTLSDDNSDVILTFTPLRDVKPLAHRLGYLDHRASPDLPDALLDGLQELWQQAKARPGPVVRPSKADQMAGNRDWNQVEALFEGRDMDDERGRVGSLVKAYAILHHKSLSLKNALDAMVALKAFITTRGAWKDGQEGERTPLLGGGDKADNSDKLATTNGPTDPAVLASLDDEGLRGEFRRMGECLQRNTHLVAHLKHIVSASMNSCDGILSSVKDYQERSSAVLKSRHQQRMDVEQRIWKAGARANQKSVDRARVQIESMERDELRQQAEIDDQEDYAVKLKGCKRWIMEDISILTPLEKRYDEKLIPKVQAVVGTEGRLPSLSSPVRATAVRPTPEALAECDKAIQQLVDYTELVSQRMVAASVDFRNTQSSYYDRIVENVEAHNPLAQAIAKAAMGRLADWRSTALRLSQAHDARTAAERQHNFEQLIDTLDAQTKAKAEESKDKRKELVDEPLNGHATADVVEPIPGSSPLEDELDMPTARDGVSTVVAVSLDPDQVAVQAALEADEDGDDWQEAGKKKAPEKEKRSGAGKGDRADKSDRYDKKKARKDKRRAAASASGKPVATTSSTSKGPKPQRDASSGSSSSTPPSINNPTSDSIKDPSGASPPTLVLPAGPTPAEAMKRAAAQPVRQLEFAAGTETGAVLTEIPTATKQAGNEVTNEATALPVKPTGHASVPVAVAAVSADQPVATTAPHNEPSQPVAVVFRRHRQQPTQPSAEATFSFSVPSNPATPLRTDPPASLPEVESFEETATHQPTPTLAAPEEQLASASPSTLIPNDPHLQSEVPHFLPVHAAPFLPGPQGYGHGPGQPYSMDPSYAYPGSFYPSYGPPDGHYPMPDMPLMMPDGTMAQPFYPTFEGAAVASLPMYSYYDMDMYLLMQQQQAQYMSGPNEMHGQAPMTHGNNHRGKSKRSRGNQSKNRRGRGAPSHPNNQASTNGMGPRGPPAASHPATTNPTAS